MLIPRRPILGRSSTGGLMPKRWLRLTERSSPARWAVGCHDCGAETSFTGEASSVQARVWYHAHFCPEAPPERLAYLTLPRLDMTGDELLSWARENPSISATWLLKQLGEDDSGQGRHRHPQDPGSHFSSFGQSMAQVAERPYDESIMCAAKRRGGSHHG